MQRPGLDRFVSFTMAAAAVFIGVLLFVLRRRNTRRFGALFSLTIVVVAGGMLFARYAHILGNLPWWIYYGIPALLTLVLTLLVLRVSAAVLLQYVPMAIGLALFMF